MSQRLTHNAIQRLLLKRFALAAATYGLALLLLWLAFFTGHYDQSLSTVTIGSALVVISQATLFALFWSGRNQRFAEVLQLVHRGLAPGLGRRGVGLGGRRQIGTRRAGAPVPMRHPRCLLEKRVGR